MSQPERRATVVLAVLVALCRTVQPADYYVNDYTTAGDVYCTAPGNNWHSGTTPADPKSSLQDVLNSYDLEPGDTVWVDTGTYTLSANLEITPADGGLSNTYVTIQGSTNLAAGGTLINRNSSSVNAYAIYLNRADSVKLRHLKLTGGYYGLYASSAPRLSLEFVEITGNSYLGLQTAGSTSLQCSHCRIHHNRYYGLYLESGAAGVDQCTVWYQGSEDIRVGSSASLAMSNSIVCSTSMAVKCFGAYAGDYNDLYCTTNLGYWMSGYAPALSDWIAATTQDMHSLSTDPLFLDPSGDVHPRSEVGVYSNGVWAVCAEHSRCIDRGAPSAAWSNETSPQRPCRQTQSQQVAYATAATTPNGVQRAPVHHQDP